MPLCSLVPPEYSIARLTCAIATGLTRRWLACRVLLKIVYLLTLTCRVLGVAVLVFRDDRAKAAELLVLRHENAVLRRHSGRVRYEPADRVVACRSGATPSPQALDGDHSRDTRDDAGLAPQAGRG